MAFTIGSEDFIPGEPIPSRYTCDGEDISPSLAWEGRPENTASFVLILDDPDAPRGVFTHWVVYDIPANANELPEAVPATDHLENGGIQGRNSWNKLGYNGPCPPAGPPHRYFFKLYALDVPTLTLPPRQTKERVLNAMQGHILDQTEVIGTYQRGG